MIDGINQLPAPLPILPKGHYVWEWLCQAMPSNAHDFIYFLRPEVLTGASNLGGIKLSTTNQYLLLTIISYYKLLLTIINYYYLLLTIINHYITIRWLVGQPPATLPFLRFSVYLRIPRIPRSPRYGASFSIGENWPGPIGDAGFGALDALDA